MSKTSLQAFSNVLRKYNLAGSFHIPNHLRQQLMSELQVDSTSLLHLCMRAIQPKAVVPVSNFCVGSAALGESGDIHMGVNVEFTNNPLTSTIHSEQFLVISCLLRGESKLLEMATSAPPCGYCRQFLNELKDGSSIMVCCRSCTDTQDAVVGTKYTLGELLPKHFGPADLFSGRKESDNVFSATRNNGLFLCGTPGLLGKEEGSTSAAILSSEGPEFGILVETAVAAANKSYCPYSHRASGVALGTSSGKVHRGWSVENAAYNPTLSPLQCAIVSIVSAGEDPSSITKVVLAEGVTRGGAAKAVTIGRSMWRSGAAQILAEIAPAAELRVIFATLLEDRDRDQLQLCCQLLNSRQLPTPGCVAVATGPEATASTAAMAAQVQADNHVRTPTLSASASDDFPRCFDLELAALSPSKDHIHTPNREGAKASMKKHKGKRMSMNVGVTVGTRTETRPSAQAESAPVQVHKKQKAAA
jgi:cytidine deaminase